MLDKIFRDGKEWGPFFPRIALGATFVVHGSGKFFGEGELRGFAGGLESMGIDFPHPMFWAVLAAGAELLGGAFLLMGFLTRYAAIAFGGVMLVGGDGFKMASVGGRVAGWEWQFALLMMCLSLLFTGGGRLSIDNWSKQRG